MNLYNTKLHAQLEEKLKQIRAQKNFNAEAWIEQKCKTLNEYMKKSGLKACVVSVSGGIDSTVTTALASHASTLPGSPIQKILLLQQPIHSTKSIVNRALLLKELQNVQIVEIDQTIIFDQLKSLINQQINIQGKQFADGNLKSYMRTPTSFYAAQLLCQEGYPAIVLGTGNLDEDGYLFYFSKAGDGISDIQLIHDIHKSEVYKVAQALKLHEDLVNAVPSADLWEGQTDENEIGWSYDAVELWVELLSTKEDVELFKRTLKASALEQFDKMKTELETTHRRNAHKAQISKGI